jgi:hypothetical protein
VVGFTPPLRLPGFGTPALTLPTFEIKPPPKLDLTLPPEPEKPGDWWKRTEEMMRRAQEIEKKLPKDNRSPVERLGDAVVQVLDPLIRKLPVSADLKKKVRDGIRDGVKAGSEKLGEAVIDAAATGPQADALKAAYKGIIQYKQDQSPGGQQ